MNSIEFGKNIRRRRKEMGLSQADLAEQLNISPNHVSSIENGKTDVSLKIVTRLCDTLKVTPDYLFLGNMHTDDISPDIVDMIKSCSEEQKKILYALVKTFINASNAK